MKEEVRKLFETTILVSKIDLFLALGLSAILSLLLVWVYRRTHRGLNYERSILTTLFLIGPILSVIMMLIGSNIALSLGMVGSLSIIRFRTVIKDSRDMIYLFWGIALGLGCGTYNFVVISLASVFLAGLILLLYSLEFGSAVHSDYVVVIQGTGLHPQSKKISTVIQKYSDQFTLRSQEHEGDRWELVFEMRLLKKEASVEDVFTADIRQMDGVTRVSLLAPQLSIPA